MLDLEVRRLLGMILERPVSSEENPSRASELKWDSLKHVELVFLLEDHFGAQFTPEDLSQMSDVHEITRILQNRLTATGKSFGPS